MAKTAAERQKAYRQRRAQEAGELRINTWVSAAALKALNTLAEQQGVTQKVLLEQIILAAASKPPKTAGRPKATGTPPAAKEQTKAAVKNQTKAPLNASSKQKPALLSAPGKPGKPAKNAKATATTKAAKAAKPARPAARPKAPVQASLWDEF